MSAHPIRTIAVREIRDTLSDWRLLAPMLILIFAFPIVLVAAANVFVRFVGDPNLIRTIIPFVMLLVGFIPASFSLITALESFVGERERNSLEALLAMPISDNQLYLSKLVSSLLPPLGSALLAVTVFALGLRIQQPDLFLGGLDTEKIITVVLLITAKAILMVAGAVIISSHTSSIRAANLLASFVLLPTAAIIQVEALYVIADLWWQLRIFALVLFMVGAILIRTGMGSFNREEILSREHEQINIARIWRTFLLFLREYQPAYTPVERYENRTFSPRRFYRREFPALLREYRLPLAVAVFGAITGTIVGWAIGQTGGFEPINRLLDQNLGRPSGFGFLFGVSIFLNNLRVSLFSSVLSLFVFGMLAFLVPTLAFGQVSLVASTLDARGGSLLPLDQRSPLTFLLTYILPHGIIELPTAIIGAALGIRIGAALMSSGRGVTVGHNMLWSLAQFFKVWALVLVPLYALAALIESCISPLLIQALY
jgi:uncharacterized membrane protein SpoIIM required for sporulation/ABC-type transport system involved in multi-copper enzyme maturation permease subunit